MLQQSHRILQIVNVRADILCACTADSNTQKCNVPRALVAAAAVTLSVNMICTQTDSLWKSLMEFCKLTMQANSLFPTPKTAAQYDIALLAT